MRAQNRWPTLYICLLISIVVLQVIVFAIVSWKPYLQLLLAIPFLILVLGLFSNYSPGRASYDAVRRDYEAALQERNPVSLEEEYHALALATGAPRPDIERLWNGLANFYRIPPDKLKISDTLNRDLRGIVQHIDYDVFTSPLVLLCRRDVRKEIQTVATWGELIHALLKIEILQGRQGTKKLDRGGRVIEVWNG